MTERTFDWVGRHDPVSRQFAVRPMVEDAPLRTKQWRAHWRRIDQGREGACVGFGFTNELLATPAQAKLPKEEEQYARDVYHWCLDNDEFEGNDDTGTSVLTGAKAMKAEGWCEEYRWAFSIDDVVKALCASAKDGGGPVVIGIPWFDSMFETRPSGLMEAPSGSIAGGHCLVLTGFHTRMSLPGEKGHKTLVKGRNSWGASWGVRGDFYIDPENLQFLLQRVWTAEACVLVQRHAVARK